MSEKDQNGSYEGTWAHLKERIKTLIIATSRYIIFVDKDGDIDWETSAAYDEAAPSEDNFNLGSHNKVINDAALLETTPCGGLDEKTIYDFKRLIGEALSCGFKHDYVTANRMLDKAQDFIRSRGEEVSRMWYLEASFWATCPFLIAGAATVVLRHPLSLVLGINGPWLIIAACAGSLGAILSIIARTGKLKFDHSGGRLLHCYEATSRVTAGVVSGLLAGIAVRSHLLFGTIIYEDKLNLVMIAVAMVAGTSERLANSIINKLTPSKDGIDQPVD